MELEETHVGNLEPCSFCGRKFNLESLYRHEAICQKTSRRRPVFDSSKQRSVQCIENKYRKNSGLKTRYSTANQHKQPSQQNWKQKHEEFIKTIRAARQVTAAIREGKELPPPPPPSVNPDYIQCPHCLRRFNKHAAERHIAFCAEQAKRMSNRNPSANHFTQKAAARASARQNYRPPLPCKKEGSAAKSSSACSNRNLVVSARSNNASTAQRKVSKSQWDSTVDLYSDKSFTKTGLKPTGTLAESTYSNKASSYSTSQTNKPTIRKTASKKFGNFSEQKFENDRPIFQTDHISTHSENDKLSNDILDTEIALKFGYEAIPVPNFSSFFESNQLHSASIPQQKPAKFCHECGTCYPIATAKFCCECGMKRIVLN